MTRPTKDELAFRPRFVFEAQVPGLPPAGGLCLAEAEQMGEKFERLYSRGAISNRFMFARKAWIRDVLANIDHPPEGDIFWYEPPLRHSFDDRRPTQKWTLPDVERMIVWFYLQGPLGYREYICGRQLVAWTARGQGVFV